MRIPVPSDNNQSRAAILRGDSVIVRETINFADVFPIFGGTMPSDDAADDRPAATDSDHDEPTGVVMPDVSGMTLRDAAHTYALAGLYLLPTRAGTVKNPGSVVGKKWQGQSSRDPAQIREWFERGADVAGIACDVGKSGAIVFDLDRDEKPDDMPQDVWDALQSSGAIQATRQGETARAHYWFACKPDEFGNSAGAFARWGEVRCSNGVVILQPTPHPDADTKNGHYHWLKTIERIALPDVLREMLSKAAQHEEPMTREQLREFLDAHTGNEEPHGLQGHLTMFTDAVERGESRHDSMTKVLVWAFREAIIKRFPAQTAYDALKFAFYQAKPEAKGTREFDRIAEWSAAQAMTADENDTRERVNRDLYADPFDPIKGDVGDFWSSSKQLADLRQFAQARLVSPTAVLGNTLARVVAHIPPNVVLPPVVGGYASLNLFVALVGPSGASKSASMAASGDWLRTEPNYAPSKPGSGEGLAKCFAYKTKLPNGGGWTQVGKQWSVLAQIPEVDTLIATGGRGGATIMSTLREGWSGERIGLDYASEEKRIVLHGNRYRLCLSLGVQPLRAQPLFDESEGGTPQRFVWFTTRDHDAPKAPPNEPAVLDIGRWRDANASLFADDSMRASELAEPADPAEFVVLAIPDNARELIISTRHAVLRGDPNVDPLDSHKLLSRLKVAAALMALEGRRGAVSQGDWQRAGVVMAMSDITRQGVLDELRSKARTENVHRGRMEAEREMVKTKVISQERQRVAAMADRIVEKLKERDGQSVSVLRKALSQQKTRHVFDDGVVYAVESSMVRREDFIAHNRQESTRLWLAAPANESRAR
ncbi:bifunctional DNA primase/polymerase [Mycolicibacterium wolinskyi]|uniref:bifunctional DNA primase/polymerase n=1 Tax=Mycolicibacterium wolinskyi TaxID=59750 RepID=UPI003917A671